MPSATTTRVWKRPHGSRSSRAGMSVSTIGLVGAGLDAALVSALRIGAKTPWRAE